MFTNVSPSGMVAKTKLILVEVGAGRNFRRLAIWSSPWYRCVSHNLSNMQQQQQPWIILFSKKCVAHPRPAQIAELPRSKFDPELFPHSAYVEIFVTFATKVPYLTFCNKM